MFKVTTLAVMLLGLVVGSGAAGTPQLKGSRALDIEDGDRALESKAGTPAGDSDNEPESVYPTSTDGQNSKDPCWKARRNLDLGCYRVITSGRGCTVIPLKEKDQKCSQDRYGYEKCSKNVCSRWSRNNRLYGRKCGTKKAAYDGVVCKAPTYKVGDKLNTCETPSTCKNGTCAPCKATSSK